MADLPQWPRYRPIRVIGQGGFGTVYLCTDTEPSSPRHKQHVAVKAVSLSALSDEEALLVMSEVSLLKNIDHPNIIAYYDSFLYDEVEATAPSSSPQRRGSSSSSGTAGRQRHSASQDADTTTNGAGAFHAQWLCLVTEYMDGGDLASLIRQYAGQQGLDSTAGGPPRAVASTTTTRTITTTARKAAPAAVNPSPPFSRASSFGHYDDYELAGDIGLDLWTSPSGPSTQRAAAAAAAAADGEAPQSASPPLCEAPPAAEALRKRRRFGSGARGGDAGAGTEHGASHADDDWASRSRLHRERLATTLRAAPRPPASAHGAGDTWMSDASEAAMPATPLGATELASAAAGSGAALHEYGLTGRAGLHTTTTAAAIEAAIPTVPQLPLQPNQLWVESFLITDIARQCLDALAYLHALCIVHRDIKPSNIYLSKRDGTVKLGDFGVSKLLQPATPFATTFVGTPFYLCPELCMGDPYSFGADVWALGVLLYELYCLKLPFTSDNVLAQIYVITEGTYDTVALRTPHAFAEAQRGVLTQLYGPNFAESEQLLHSLVVALVSQMLRIDPAERPSAEMLLSTMFGIGSRAASSAGLQTSMPTMLSAAAPTPMRRPPSAGLVAARDSTAGASSAAAAAAAAPASRRGSLTPSPSGPAAGGGRLGPTASDQHAAWAGSLVAAAGNALLAQPAASPTRASAPASSHSPSGAAGQHRSRRSSGRQDEASASLAASSTPLAVRVRTGVSDLLQAMPSGPRERLGSRAAAEAREEQEELARALPPASLLSASSNEWAWVEGRTSASASRNGAPLSRDGARPPRRGETEAAVTTRATPASTSAVAAVGRASVDLTEFSALHLLSSAPLPQRHGAGTDATLAKTAATVLGPEALFSSTREKSAGRPATGGGAAPAQLAADASYSLSSSAGAALLGDALDRPIGAHTRSEITALVENIPWLRNAEVFSAILLSAGCDDVMLVERANRGSASSSGGGGSVLATAQIGEGEGRAGVSYSVLAAMRDQPASPAGRPRAPQSAAASEAGLFASADVAAAALPSPPVRYAGIVSRGNSRSGEGAGEVTRLGEGPAAYANGAGAARRGSAAGPAEGSRVGPLLQRRVSTGAAAIIPSLATTAAAAGAAAAEVLMPSAAAPRRQRVSVTALSASALSAGVPQLSSSSSNNGSNSVGHDGKVTSAPSSSSAAQASKTKAGDKTAEVKAAKQSLPTSGATGTSAATGQRVHMADSLSPTRTSAGLATESRLRPVSAAAAAAAVAAAVGGRGAYGGPTSGAAGASPAPAVPIVPAGASALPPTPKARSPGRIEGYSTTELEALLRAKLLAHYQRRQQQFRAQRAAQAEQEAIKAAARARLKAVYDEAYVSRLGTASPDEARLTASYHSADTTAEFPTASSEVLATATASLGKPSGRPAPKRGNGPAHTFAGDSFAGSTSCDTMPGEPLVRTGTQRPALDRDAFAKGGTAAATTTATPPSFFVSQSSTPLQALPSAPVADLDTPLPFSLEATTRQAQSEEPVMRALSARHGAPVPPSARVTSKPPSGRATSPVGGLRGDDVDWLTTTPAARRVREAAALAAAVAQQRAAFRSGTGPARLHVAPPWRPPHDSRDVPGLWETSSAEEEGDAAARGRLGWPAPAEVREELRWRWSAPPSELADSASSSSSDASDATDTDTESDDEGKGPARGRATSTASPAPVSYSPSTHAYTPPPRLSRCSAVLQRWDKRRPDSAEDTGKSTRAARAQERRLRQERRRRARHGATDHAAGGEVDADEQAAAAEAAHDTEAGEREDEGEAEVHAEEQLAALPMSCGLPVPLVEVDSTPSSAPVSLLAAIDAAAAAASSSSISVPLYMSSRRRRRRTVVVISPALRGASPAEWVVTPPPPPPPPAPSSTSSATASLSYAVSTPHDSTAEEQTAPDSSSTSSSSSSGDGTAKEAGVDSDSSSSGDDDAASVSGSSSSPSSDDTGSSTSSGSGDSDDSDEVDEDDDTEHPSSTSQTLSYSFPGFDGADAAAKSRKTGAGALAGTGKGRRRGAARDEDDDMSYAYVVQLDAATGQRFLDYVCPVTVEVTGALPPGSRVVSATAFAAESLKPADIRGTPTGAAALVTDSTASAPYPAPGSALELLSAYNPDNLPALVPSPLPTVSVTTAQSSTHSLDQTHDSWFGTADYHLMGWAEGGGGSGYAGPSAAGPADGEDMQPQMRRLPSLPPPPLPHLGGVASAAPSTPSPAPSSAGTPSRHSAPPARHAASTTAAATATAARAEVSATAHIRGGHAASALQATGAPAPVAAPLRGVHPALAAPPRRTPEAFIAPVSPPTSQTTARARGCDGDGLRAVHAAMPTSPFGGVATGGVVGLTSPPLPLAFAEDGVGWRVAVPAQSSPPTLYRSTSGLQLPLTAPPPATSPVPGQAPRSTQLAVSQYIRLPLSLALRPLRQRTRLVGLLWRLWVAMQVADPALRRVLLDKHRDAAASLSLASPAMTFAEAFGDWATGTRGTSHHATAAESASETSSNRSGSRSRSFPTGSGNTPEATESSDEEEEDGDASDMAGSSTASPASSSWVSSSLATSLVAQTPSRRWDLYYVDPRSLCAVRLRTDADWAVVRGKVADMAALLPFIRLHLVLETAEPAREAEA